MDRATRSKIEEWDARPVSGGYAGLADLAAAEFTGAVTAGGAALFMLNGRVVGVVDGTVSTFESAEATAYEAPDPALPLLFAMRARGGEVQGQYYTDDTPIDEVDQTLTEGGFTGYIELAENVLSGDYFVVYYGGRSLSAAFIGNEERVVTGTEAYDLATDEVGIYQVRSVDLEVTDVPEPTEPADAAAEAATAAAAGAGTDVASEAERAQPGEEAPSDADDATSEAEDEDDDAPDETPSESEGEKAGEADDPASPEVEDVAEAEATSTASEPDGDAGAGAADDPSTEPVAPAEESGAPDVEVTSVDANGGDDATAVEPESGGTAGASAEGASAPEPAAPPRGEPGVAEPDERFREEERWRESRTVPALDPEESAVPEEGSSTSADPQAQQPTQPRTAAAPTADRRELETLRERIDELEAALESSEEERRRQAERVDDLTGERDALRTERDDLQARVEELEARIAAEPAESAGETGASPSHGGSDGTIDAATAMDQTDLFVRYASKGQATLQTAHDGRAEASEVAENLRIEVHSRFDAETATVDGRPFREYLEDTIEYRFVDWLVGDLLYEIQDTDSERGLRRLYDLLPKIDRAEFAGAVTALGEEDEELEIAFDVVCRDRMGQPLLVANINDSLDPATGEMMGGLIEDATAAAEKHDTLGAAFMVTASFFQPDALETASGATGGGFLSRDSKKSFVKHARKGGYHLCLAEARGGDFHVAVPEF